MLIYNWNNIKTKVVSVKTQQDTSNVKIVLKLTNDKTFYFWKKHSMKWGQQPLILLLISTKKVVTTGWDLKNTLLTTEWTEVKHGIHVPYKLLIKYYSKGLSLPKNHMWNSYIFFF